MAEERIHVAERGEADAEHVRIFHRVDELVERVRIESALQADVDGEAAGQLRRVEVLWI